MRKLSLILFLIVCLFKTKIYAQNVDNHNWLTILPKCPCENPDLQGIRLGDGWAKDKGNIQKYHPGSYECFRSYPYIKTNVGKSGQQCCYDKYGLLIKSGSGAGTPDKISTCSGEDNNGIMKTRFLGLLGHYFKDVRPWQKAGTPDKAWIIYNKTWKPDNGNGCLK